MFNKEGISYKDKLLYKWERRNIPGDRESINQKLKEDQDFNSRHKNHLTFFDPKTFCGQSSRYILIDGHDGSTIWLDYKGETLYASIAHFSRAKTYSDLEEASDEPGTNREVFIAGPQLGKINEDVKTFKARVRTEPDLKKFLDSLSNAIEQKNEQRLKELMNLDSARTLYSVFALVYGKDDNLDQNWKPYIPWIHLEHIPVIYKNPDIVSEKFYAHYIIETGPRKDNGITFDFCPPDSFNNDETICTNWTQCGLSKDPLKGWYLGNCGFHVKRP